MTPDETRYRVIKAIEANPECNQRELAQALGMALGKTNYALKALIEAGMVRADRFAKSDHKLGYLYVLTPSGVAERVKLAAALLQRKQDEYRALEAEIERLKSEVK